MATVGWRNGAISRTGAVYLDIVSTWRYGGSKTSSTSGIHVLVSTRTRYLCQWSNFQTGTLGRMRFSHSVHGECVQGTSEPNTRLRRYWRQHWQLYHASALY